MADPVRTVLLVRHAKAESRRAWDRPDHLRPLSKKGRAQAEALAEAWSDQPIRAVRSSPAVRCVQTVTPLCERLGIECAIDEALMEGGAIALPSAAGTYVICAHGDNIPALLAALGIDGSACRKGSTWRLDFDQRGTLTAASYTDCPL